MVLVLIMIFVEQYCLIFEDCFRGYLVIVGMLLWFRFKKEIKELFVGLK